MDTKRMFAYVFVSIGTVKHIWMLSLLYVMRDKSMQSTNVSHIGRICYLQASGARPAEVLSERREGRFRDSLRHFAAPDRRSCRTVIFRRGNGAG